MSEQSSVTVEEWWAQYAQLAMHPGAGKVQIWETKKAFYAGTMRMLTALLHEADREDATDNSLEDFADRIVEELGKFAEEVNRINKELAE